MKRFNVFTVFLLFFFTCKGQESKNATTRGQHTNKEVRAFGDKIDPSGSISGADMAFRYGNMVLADTLAIKFKGTVTSVCQVKGCWIKVALAPNSEVMVRFKDYGFFMPKDIQGRDVVLNGLAFVEEMGVEDQKHFAKDAGKSPKEIAKIKGVKKTYRFEANGVLLNN